MRVAIVNDVVMAIEAVRRVLANAREHQLAWVALNGLEAVERCAADTPDLILMDLVMPKMDGVEATRRIMASTPCAIVVVTANVDESSSKVFEAMGAGALDAVNTPVLASADGGEGEIALLAKIETIHRLLGGSRGRRPATNLDRAPLAPGSYCGSLVAVGASAGGPAALAKILAPLPADFPAPVIIVQHVDAQFANGLARWLDCQTELHVRLAQEGEYPSAGTVLLAGGDQHLVFANPSRLAFTRHPADCSCSPSIDVFFKSVERYWRGDVIGLVLTGMGRDGAEGLRALHVKGHHTIAQDEATSAVYGMPKAAAQIHAATEILPLDKIADRITNILAQKAKMHG